jgi:hypothetical protein
LSGVVAGFSPLAGVAGSALAGLGVTAGVARSSAALAGGTASGLRAFLGFSPGWQPAARRVEKSRTVSKRRK